MLYIICYITSNWRLYNQWGFCYVARCLLYNKKLCYIAHPNLPDVESESIMVVACVCEDSLARQDHKAWPNWVSHLPGHIHSSVAGVNFGSHGHRGTGGTVYTGSLARRRPARGTGRCYTACPNRRHLGGREVLYNIHVLLYTTFITQHKTRGI